MLGGLQPADPVQGLLLLGPPLRKRPLRGPLSLCIQGGMGSWSEPSDHVVTVDEQRREGRRRACPPGPLSGTIPDVRPPLTERIPQCMLGSPGSNGPSRPFHRSKPRPYRRARSSSPSSRALLGSAVATGWPTAPPA